MAPSNGARVPAPITKRGSTTFLPEMRPLPQNSRLPELNEGRRDGGGGRMSAGAGIALEPPLQRWLTVGEVATYFGRSVSWVKQALEHFDDRGARVGWIPWVRVEAADGSFQRSSDETTQARGRAAAERLVDRRLLDALSDHMTWGEVMDAERLREWARHVLEHPSRSAAVRRST